MKHFAHLLLPMIASALLCAAAPDESKTTPVVAEVDLATSQPAGKPTCTAAIEGHQWPDEATDPIFAAALAPYGYPMVCRHTGSTYTWRSVTPREQPKKSDKPAPIGAPPLPKLAAQKH